MTAPISILDAPRITRKDLAARLGVAPESVDRYVRIGILKDGERIKLPRVRCGGRAWFLIEDVEKWLRDTSANMESSAAVEQETEAQHADAMRELEKLGV